MYDSKPVVLIICVLCSSVATHIQAATTRRISVDEYRDKMKAGWIGQMVGVGWGGPTEFKWQGQIIPEDKMPQWSSGKINQFGQDDIYVEMTFLKTLEDYGLDCSIRQAGIDLHPASKALLHVRPCSNWAVMTGSRSG
jgi:hypothetical protein